MNVGRMTIGFLAAACFLIAVAVWIPRPALAHRSGCHNLHTCPSDTNAYVCGDLGYACDGSTSLEQVKPGTINVPLLIESIFVQTFGRVPTIAESAYWKTRFRAEKDSVYKIRRTMAWHQVNGSFGPSFAPPAGGAMAGKASNLVPRINAIFRLVYDGRSPTVSENHYWLTRIKDKPTEAALKDTMLFHRVSGTLH